MHDINLPFSSGSLEFSGGIMDSLSSPKEKSFTVRDRRNLDVCSNKVNNYLGHRKIFDKSESNNEDKWNGRHTFPLVDMHFSSASAIYVALLLIASSLLKIKRQPL